MTIAIKHAFVSLKGDGTDATQVQPSNWNAVHAFTLATGQLIGRLTAGAGTAEEIPISAYFASLLTTADQATLAGLLGLFETGDVKYTFRSSASAGWLLIATGGSIGDATSGASLRANADTFALYTVIYNSCSDALAPVSGGRGANATADFNAHKTLTIPQLAGRSPIGAGAANAPITSARTLGQTYGEENHTLITAELAAHTHANSLTDPTHDHEAIPGQVGGTAGGTPPLQGINGSLTPHSRTGFSATGITITNASAGSGTPHNVLHPVIALNAMVKL